MISNKNRSKRGPKRGLNEVVWPLLITPFYQVLPFKLYQKRVQNHDFDPFLTPFWSPPDQHLIDLNDSPVVFFPNPQIRGQKQVSPKGVQKGQSLYISDVFVKNFSKLIDFDQNWQKPIKNWSKIGFFQFLTVFSKIGRFFSPEVKIAFFGSKHVENSEIGEGGVDPLLDTFTFLGVQKRGPKKGHFFIKNRWILTLFKNAEFLENWSFKNRQNWTTFLHFHGSKNGSQKWTPPKSPILRLKIFGFWRSAKNPGFWPLFSKKSLFQKKGSFFALFSIFLMIKKRKKRSKMGHFGSFWALFDGPVKIQYFWQKPRTTP